MRGHDDQIAFAFVCGIENPLRRRDVIENVYGLARNARLGCLILDSPQPLRVTTPPQEVFEVNAPVWVEIDTAQLTVIQ